MVLFPYMRISIAARGYYDWAACPPGTKITEADVSALRVKQMNDGTWHMRVEVKRPTTHDVGVHEDQICRRLAACAKFGKELSRADVVVEQLQHTNRHHLAAKHIGEISVHDDGPNQDLMKATLAELEVTGDAATECLGRYTEPRDLTAHLNTVLGTKESS